MTRLERHATATSGVMHGRSRSISSCATGRWSPQPIARAPTSPSPLAGSPPSGRALGPGREEIDASGRLVLPGGIDSHCHVAQKSSTGLMTADDFHTATLAAVCGGTTTIIPFAAQHRGQSLRDVVDGIPSPRVG